MLHTCVFIASHISSEKRIPYLHACVRSIISQSSIALSISFENESLKAKTLTMLADYNIKMVIRETKTSQMNHFRLMVEEVDKDEYDWIFFCDDDDYYEPDRIDTFKKILKDVEMDPSFSGIYESQEGQSHQQFRYEYWSYCMRPAILKRFFSIIAASNQLDTLENACCDIMLVEYLRRLDPTVYKFYRLDTPVLYHYRKVDNEESVTETIYRNERAMRKPNPPSVASEQFADYIVEWNNYLYENFHFYKHDVFLRTIVGCELEYILKTEFKEDYLYLDFIDSCHVEILTKYYYRLKKLCSSLYAT